MFVSRATASRFLLGSMRNAAEPSCRPTYNNSLLTPKSYDEAMMTKKMETTELNSERNPEKAAESSGGSCISTHLRLFDESWAALKSASGKSLVKRRKVESVKVQAVADKPVVSTELRLFDESWLANKKVPPAAATMDSNEKQKFGQKSGKETGFRSDHSEILTHSTASFDNSSKAKNAITSEVVSSTSTAGNPSVSTALKLFDVSWLVTANPPSSTEADHTRKLGGAAQRQRPPLILEKMRINTTKDLKQESANGVSTNLKLFEDPWKIKKKLTSSDLGNLCRLLVASNLIKANVLPYMSVEITNQVESIQGAPVSVWDADTRTVHRLVLKRWPTSKSYVFIEGWTQEFVKRRGLKEGDEIGLYWDIHNSRFNFCVSNRR